MGDIYLPIGGHIIAFFLEHIFLELHEVIIDHVPQFSWQLEEGKRTDVLHFGSCYDVSESLRAFRVIRRR